MIRAVVRGGLIHPVDPLPPGWKEGQEVEVQEAQLIDDSPEAIARWIEEMEALADDIDPEDVRRVEAALAEADRLAKAQARREVGLP